MFRNLKVPAIKFDEFSRHDFVTWLSTLKCENGKWWTYSSHTNHRSGLCHLHMNYEVEVTEGFRLIVNDFFRILSKQKHNEAINMKNGKSMLIVILTSRFRQHSFKRKENHYKLTSKTRHNEIVKDALKISERQTEKHRVRNLDLVLHVNGKKNQMNLVANLKSN